MHLRSFRRPLVMLVVPPLALATLAGCTSTTPASPITVVAASSASAAPGVPATPAPAASGTSAPGASASPAASGGIRDVAELTRRSHAALDGITSYHQVMTLQDGRSGTGETTTQELDADVTDRQHQRFQGTVTVQGRTELVVQADGTMYRSTDGGATFSAQVAPTPSYTPSEADVLAGVSNFHQVGPRTVGDHTCTEYAWDKPATGMRPASVTAEPNRFTSCLDAQDRPVTWSLSIAQYADDGALTGHSVTTWTMSRFNEPVTITAPSAAQVTSSGAPTPTPAPSR